MKKFAKIQGMSARLQVKVGLLPNHPNARKTAQHLTIIARRIDELQNSLNYLSNIDDPDVSVREQIATQAARLIGLRALEEELDATLLLVARLAQAPQLSLIHPRTDQPP